MRASGLMRQWALVLFCALLGLALSSCQKTEQKRRTVGYKGEARGNAFLAAQRLLERQGYSVSFKRNMGDLDADTATLFLTPSSLNTVGRSKRVLRWVGEGGHLVVMLKAGEKINVIPGQAEFYIDGRTLPGQTTDDFIREIKKVIGKDFDIPGSTSHGSTIIVFQFSVCR